MILTKKNAPASSSTTRAAAPLATTSSSAVGTQVTTPSGVWAADTGSICSELADTGMLEPGFGSFQLTMDLHSSPGAAPVSDDSLPTAATTTTTPKRSQGKSNAKRKKFNKYDDLLLLRQVNADHPYKTARGGVMDAWASVARKLKRLQDFTKAELTGKSAQARFNVLIERHRAYNKASAAASGVSEDHDEAIQLLDDLLLEVDEHARVEELKSEEQKEKLAVEEKTGKYIRDEAVSRLKKRKEHPDDIHAETPLPRKVTVFDIMREDNEMERKMRAAQWEQKQEMKRQQREDELNDRKEEREFRLQIARLENEKFKTLLQLTKMKSGGEIISVDSDNADS